MRSNDYNEATKKKMDLIFFVSVHKETILV